MISQEFLNLFVQSAVDTAKLEIELMEIETEIARLLIEKRELESKVKERKARIGSAMNHYLGSRFG